MENRQPYVDGFLIPLPTAHIDRYRHIATEAGRIWTEHGALAYYECIGDDLDHENLVPFTRSAAAGEGEMVIFAWIVFASREDRDRINAAVMADPRLAALMNPGEPDVFDMKRMAYGGFRTLVAFDRT